MILATRQVLHRQWFFATFKIAAYFLLFSCSLDTSYTLKLGDGALMCDFTGVLSCCVQGTVASEVVSTGDINITRRPV